MKSNKALWAGIAVLGLSAVGCTPSPDRMCSHFMDLSNRAHPMSASERASQQADCVRDMTAARARNADLYKTAARCVMNASDENVATGCVLPLMAGGH